MRGWRRRRWRRIWLRASQALRALAKLANRLNRKRRIFAEVEEKLIHGPDRPMVLCLSDYVKGMILRHYPDISGQMVKLFNGTDLEQFDPVGMHRRGRRFGERFGIDGDATVALMIAQHFERKGLAEVIAAAANIGKDSPSDPWCWSSARTIRRGCRRLAKRLGVEE